MEGLVGKLVAWGEKRYGKITPCGKTWQECLVKRDGKLEFRFNIGSGTTRVVILVPRNGYYKVIEPKNEAELMRNRERDKHNYEGCPQARSFSSCLHSWQGKSEGTSFFIDLKKPKEVYGDGTIKVY